MLVYTPSQVCAPTQREWGYRTVCTTHFFLGDLRRRGRGQVSV